MRSVPRFLCQVIKVKPRKPPSSGLRLAQIIAALSGAGASTLRAPLPTGA